MSYVELPTHSKDVVKFCEQRLDPIKMNDLIVADGGVGLSNPQLEEWLREPDYVNVLTCVWSERDRQKRLEWLRIQAANLHPPLMFELAVAEFTHNPIPETINTISSPLIMAADYRVRQDSICCKDPSISKGDSNQYLRMIYEEALIKLTKKHLGKNVNDLIVQEIRTPYINALFKTVFTSSLTIELGNPNWLSYHGINANGVLGPFDLKKATVSPKKIKELRDEFATKILSQLP